MSVVKVSNSENQAVAQGGTTHVQRTISGTAVNLSNFTPSAYTTHVLVQFNTATARVTFDGTTTPTTTLGFRYLAGSSAYFNVLQFQKAKVIAETATDVILEIQELNYL